ncbi:hypothetical protein BTVI_95118 [Pitangus sulphuratus]|nr:hypothetical protein BTVI_95118 [Pitangus sulphuratus]
MFKVQLMQLNAALCRDTQGRYGLVTPVPKLRLSSSGTRWRHAPYADMSEPAWYQHCTPGTVYGDKIQAREWICQLSVEFLLTLFGIYTILWTTLNDYMYAHAMVSTMITKLAQLMLN